MTDTNPLEKPPISDDRKEQILTNSPFLKALFKPESQDPLVKRATLLKAENALSERVAEEYGESWKTNVIGPLHIVAKLNHFFPKEKTSEIDRWAAVATLVEIGYEIGNHKETELFLPEIAKFLFENGLFDTRNTNFQGVVSLIDAGVYLRNLQDGITTIMIKDKNDPFSSFINSLDI